MIIKISTPLLFSDAGYCSIGKDRVAIFGLRHRALSGRLWFPLTFRLAGLCFLSPPVPAAELARSYDNVGSI
jgi:hypothetical protein